MRDARAILLPALILLAGWLAQGAQTASLTLVRHFTPASARYQYVPFELPQDVASLRITYQYARANGDNVVDLGLFEPGPLDLGTPAFRGYSGGARPAITLSAAATTPGYRRGPLPPGRWHVLLGLYKVSEAGVDVTITVDMEAGPPAPEPKTVAQGGRDSRPALRIPARRPRQTGEAAAGWYMGALHTHTLHSDGTLEPAELLRRFGELRFDFVAVTDHNNTTHRYELGPQREDDPPKGPETPNDPPKAPNTPNTPKGASPLWIVGEEITTPGGHANVWGLDEGEWVDFRVSPGDSRIKDLVAAAKRQGAVFSVNHPASECGGCGWTHEFVEGIDGIEISNGRHGEIANAVAIWDKLLRTGRRITAVGSSDWHSAPNPLDVANVRVYATALTTDGILAAIRGGHVIVMRSARDATPDVVVRTGGQTARVGDSLKVTAGSFVTMEVNAPDLAGGRLVVVQNGEPNKSVDLDAQGTARVEQRAAVGYVRFEIYATDGIPIAITNPVYLVKQ